MKQYNNKYRDFTISMTEINDDRVVFKILNPDKSVVEDTEGSCVTIEQAMDECKGIIDDLIEERS